MYGKIQEKGQKQNEANGRKPYNCNLTPEFSTHTAVGADITSEHMADSHTEPQGQEIKTLSLLH